MLPWLKQLLDIAKVFRKTSVEKYYLFWRDSIPKAKETEHIWKHLNFKPRNDSSFCKLSKLQIANQEEKD